MPQVQNWVKANTPQQYFLAFKIFMFWDHSMPNTSISMFYHWIVALRFFIFSSDLLLFRNRSSDLESQMVTGQWHGQGQEEGRFPLIINNNDNNFRFLLLMCEKMLFSLAAPVINKNYTKFKNFAALVGTSDGS